MAGVELKANPTATERAASPRPGRLAARRNGRKAAARRALAPVALALALALALAGCAQGGFSSFADAYDNGSTAQQIEYAVRNGLLEEVGFSQFTFDNGNTGWKTYDAENEATVSYFISRDGEPVGMIEGPYLDYDLGVRVYSNGGEYEVRLQGDGFSYRCRLSAVDMTLTDSLEYGTDYYEIFEEKGVTKADVQDLLELYSRLTLGYLGELYARSGGAASRADFQFQTDAGPIRSHFPSFPDAESVEWYSEADAGIGLSTTELHVFARFDSPAELDALLESSQLSEAAAEIGAEHVPESVAEGEEWRQVLDLPFAFQDGVAQTDLMNTEVYVNGDRTLMYLHAIGE